ncbi:hypothetical protein DTO280E4_8352 [Paecilomyces variotii]|nr:hypothetical protein DTO169E5_5320 [Paecilomyces variotii]KAJ9261113.1 hypothetical protein DTO207G8_263 [Paecilomyces variotii]KAJ9351017.1 hypothetical protein DTO027B9_6602 [Paecilomyces variotii]KAJ9351206.1 hypothetical protein DTO280E4_8352 [Paecilomyces variotii]KAJ9393008.1 hypothetical protein DTO063F5_145 [Paecilomyces variotii]
MNARMECKANKRNEALPSVQFQEASQIAAWLVQDHRPASAAIEASSYTTRVTKKARKSFLCQSITRLIAPDLISSSKDGIPSAKLFKLATEEKNQSGDILTFHTTIQSNFTGSQPVGNQLLLMAMRR